MQERKVLYLSIIGTLIQYIITSYLRNVQSSILLDIVCFLIKKGDLCRLFDIFFNIDVNRVRRFISTNTAAMSSFAEMIPNIVHLILTAGIFISVRRCLLLF